MSNLVMRDCSNPVCQHYIHEENNRLNCRIYNIFDLNLGTCPNYRRMTETVGPSDETTELVVTPESEAHVKALEAQVGGGHYKDLAIQPLEYCQRNRLNHCESAVVKYITRHKDKGGAEDIKKAIHYLECLLEIDYNETMC